MTTHLSTRLVWHNSGWDERICKEPHLNASCIVYEYIGRDRDDKKEKSATREALANLKDWC